MALYKAKADAAVLAEAQMEATTTLAGGIAHDYNNLMSIPALPVVKLQTVPVVVPTALTESTRV